MIVFTRLAILFSIITIFFNVCWASEDTVGRPLALVRASSNLLAPLGRHEAVFRLPRECGGGKVKVFMELSSDDHIGVDKRIDRMVVRIRNTRVLIPDEVLEDIHTPHLHTFIVEQPRDSCKTKPLTDVIISFRYGTNMTSDTSEAAFQYSYTYLSLIEIYIQEGRVKKRDVAEIDENGIWRKWVDEY